MQQAPTRAGACTLSDGYAVKAWDQAALDNEAKVQVMTAVCAVKQ